MPSILYDSSHWLACAHEARKLAEQMTDQEAKLQMQTIAQGYERIAQHADEQAKLKEKYKISD